jgi:hypothetical protein
MSTVNDEKLSPLHSRSFLGWGNKRVNCLFTYKANQDIHFGVSWQCSPWIIKYARLKIVDAQLMVIFRMRQEHVL